MTNKKKRASSVRPEAQPSATLSITALAFVVDSEHGRPRYWAVEPVDETPRKQIQAQRVGAKYAIEYAHWLRANPELVGMGTLGWIAADIDYRDADCTGYWIGFFSCIEQMLSNVASAT